MINKNLVQSRFAKNLKNYDDNAKIQRKMAEKLLTLINNNTPKKVLEIGCGTGLLTKLINENLEYDLYTAIDIVEECKLYIDSINPDINFINVDIEEFVKDNNEKYDLIISNAALQWVDDFGATVEALKFCLSKNGELIFSTFGVENFKEIYHIIGKSLKYYSLQELAAIFPEALIDQEIHIMAFNEPKDVLRHLQQTGVNSLESQVWTKKDLEKFENSYHNICSKRPTLTYNPIYVKLNG